MRCSRSRRTCEQRVVGQRDAIARDRRRAAQGRGGLPRRAARSARSCSSGRPASARPRWRRRSPRCCSPARELTRIDMSELQRGARGRAPARRSARLRRPRRRRPAHRSRCARRPYQLVLLDEIEKAHRDVLLALLAAARRGAADRRPRPHRRLHEHRDRDDLEPRRARLHRAARAGRVRGGARARRTESQATRASSARSPPRARRCRPSCGTASTSRWYFARARSRRRGAHRPAHDRAACGARAARARRTARGRDERYRCADRCGRLRSGARRAPDAPHRGPALEAPLAQGDLGGRDPARSPVVARGCGDRSRSSAPSCPPRPSEPA